MEEAVKEMDRRLVKIEDSFTWIKDTLKEVKDDVKAIRERENK